MTFTSEVVVKVGLDQELEVIHLLQVKSSLDHFLKLAEIHHQLLYVSHTPITAIMSAFFPDQLAAPLLIIFNSFSPLIFMFSF